MDKDADKLWNRVAATVNPIERSSTRMLTPAELKQVRDTDNELDRNLDRLFAFRKPLFNFGAPKPLRLPVSPSALDLHGLTVQDAHRATLAFIENSGRRTTITIITGKSGVIRREFERWIEHIPKVHSWRVKCDGGAFTIRILKSHRSPKP